MTASGLGAQLGLKKETTWGTAETVNTFLPLTGDSIEQQFQYIETAGLQAGSLVQQEGLHRQTTLSVEGGITLDVTTKKFGHLLNTLHGGTVTPTQQGGTAAYKQTHNIGTTTPDGSTSKSLTLQVAKPDTGGTTRAFTYAGMKTQSVTFSCEKGGVLTSAWNFVGKSETTDTSLASASYSYGTTFSFQEASIEFDDSVLLDCVNSANITITIPQATDRYCLGNGQYRKEPIVNGLIAVEAVLDMEFSSLTQYNAYKNATRRKFELIFTGTTAIESSYYPTIKFTCASTVTKGSSPTVQGADILTQSVPLQCVSDGSNVPLVIEYISTDTTL